MGSQFEAASFSFSNLSVEKSSLPDKVSLFFVKTKSETATKELTEAFEDSSKLEFQPKWITEEEVLQYKPNKRDVFVVDPFAGPAFDYLAEICVNQGRSNGSVFRKEQCVRLIGPRCFLTCLQKSIPVPEMLYPIYNIAMYKLTITTTGFDADTKADIQNKITLMGGGYLNAFHGHITHLIAASPSSEKYQVAVARGVPIMGVEWVERVWDISRSETVHATDSQFASCCFPVFRSLIICGSQMGKAVKQKLKDVVEKNGGKYMGKLYQDVTSYLIINEAVGEKYVSAKKWNIPCVKPDWIYDCVERGHLLDISQYAVEQGHKFSTPQHSPERELKFNDTGLSTIFPDQSHRNVQDTIITENGSFLSKLIDWVEELNDLNISSLNQEEHLLDGFKVYLMGFTDSQVDKIKKVLNACGATYYQRLRTTVSHIILPGASSSHLVNVDKLSNKTKVINIQWLLDSCKKGEVQDEIDYLCCDVQNEEMTPIKKNTAKKASQSSSRKVKTAAQPPLDLDMNTESMVDVDLLQQYTQCLDTQEMTVESKGLFKGLSFVLGDFISCGRLYEKVVSDIEEHGGIVKKDRTVAEKADYYIIESNFGDKWKAYAKEIISTVWLNDCWSQKQILPVLYYHKPQPEREGFPLEGCCVVLSGFQGWERVYLTYLISTLGANYAEMMSRRDVPDQGMIAATHLICHQASGSKFDAAVSWGLPVLKKEWLLDCAELWNLLDITSYSLVKSKSTSDKIEFSDVRQNMSEISRPSTPTADNRLKSLRPDIREKVLHMSTPKTPHGLNDALTQSSPSPFTRKVQKALIESLPEEPPWKKRLVESPSLKDIVREGNQKWFPELETKTQKSVMNNKTPKPKIKKASDSIIVNDENIENNQKKPSDLSLQLEVLMNETRRTVLLEKQNSTPQKKMMRPKRTEIDSQQDSERFSEAPATESQGGMITWDDPVRRSEMEKVGKNLSWPSSKSEISVDAFKYPRSAFSNFVFSVSRISDDELKQKLISIVKDLGGIFIDGNNYDPALTHIITGAPARSEKMLASIAAGKWVLKPEYLNISEDQGYFVKEDEFLWGKNSEDPILMTISSFEKNLALAAYRWHCHIMQNKPKPFQHIVGFLHMSKPQKTQSFVRVLEAGGGRISRAKLPLTLPLDTTHVFVDANKGLEGINIEQLAKHKIVCLDPYYLFDCLSMESELDVKQYMLPEFLEVYRRFNK